MSENLCASIEKSGASCTVYNCDAVCSAQTTVFDSSNNGQVDQQGVQEKAKFGCFDICFEVHFDAESWANFAEDRNSGLAVRSTKLDPSAFNIANINSVMEDLAQEALVTTVIQGPDNLPTGVEGGYQCLDGSQADIGDNHGTLDCLQTDTEDNGFVTTCADANACTEDELSEVSQVVPISNTQSTQLSGINCFDGLNGGCSHNCAGTGLNGTCSCPNECWQLDTDGLMCSVKAEMVELVCHPDMMEAHLAKCVVAGLTDFSLGSSVCTDKTDTNGMSANGMNAAIKNGACAGTSVVGVDKDLDGDGESDDGCLAFAIKLDECSTQVNADYMNDTITFRQELSSEVMDLNIQTNSLGNTGTNAAISHAPRVAIDFTCQYTSDYTTQAEEVETSPDAVTHDLISQGRFSYALDTVQPSEADFDQLTNQWSTVHSTASAEHNYMVGSTLYFRICSQHELSNVHFSVPDCTVKNHDETESYKIIDDHCLDPFVSTQRVGRWTDNRFNLWTTSQNEMPTGSSLSATNLATDQCLLFSYTVFEFISNSEESNDLKLTCNVKACEFSETNPDNMAPCVENTCGGGRKRRSILEKEEYVTVSQSFSIFRNQN